MREFTVQITADGGATLTGDLGFGGADGITIYPDDDLTLHGLKDGDVVNIKCAPRRPVRPVRRRWWKRLGGWGNW